MIPRNTIITVRRTPPLNSKKPAVLEIASSELWKEVSTKGEKAGAGDKDVDIDKKPVKRRSCPPEYLCPICRDIYVDPCIARCCGRSACSRCFGGAAQAVEPPVRSEKAEVKPEPTLKLEMKLEKAKVESKIEIVELDLEPTIEVLHLDFEVPKGSCPLCHKLWAEATVPIPNWSLLETVRSLDLQYFTLPSDSKAAIAARVDAAGQRAGAAGLPMFHAPPHAGGGPFVFGHHPSVPPHAWHALPPWFPQHAPLPPQPAMLSLEQFNSWQQSLGKPERRRSSDKKKKACGKQSKKDKKRKRAEKKDVRKRSKKQRKKDVPSATPSLSGSDGDGEPEEIDSGDDSDVLAVGVSLDNNVPELATDYFDRLNVVEDSDVEDEHPQDANSRSSSS